MAMFSLFFSRLTGRSRHVKNERQAQQTHSPQTEHKSFISFMGKGSKAKTPKKQELSDPESSIDDDDVQREAMIRKSLASRASSRNARRMSRVSTKRMSHASFGTTDDSTCLPEVASVDSEEDDEDDQSESERGEGSRGGAHRRGQSSSSSSRPTNRANLKMDWKAYEAGLQRNRSVLIRNHPGIDRSTSMPTGPSRAQFTIPRRPIQSNPTSPIGQAPRPNAAY